jgi:diguanylate cyclase (GGDEF)-like protein/putative nucleotidyltransferase with HDIG domain
MTDGAPLRRSTATAAYSRHPFLCKQMRNRENRQFADYFSDFSVKIFYPISTCIKLSTEKTTMSSENNDEIESRRKAARSALKSEIKQLLLVSPVASNLMHLTNDDTSKIEDISRLIENDPALAAKILQNVNSAAYGLPKQISSIHRAVNLLGVSAVRRISLALIFYNRLIKLGGKQPFDPLFFWQHCLFVASLSRHMALAFGHPNPDLVYTAGLLHDIGKIVLETHGKLTYSDFISSIGNNWRSTLEEERLFFGVTHTEMGHFLCLEWQLPAPITAVVARHHNFPEPGSPYAEFQMEIAIVSFANYIAWMHGIASISIESPPTLQKQVLEAINIDQLDLEALLQWVDKEMLSIQEFFGIRFPHSSRLRAALVKTSITLSQLGSDNLHTANPQKDRVIPSSLTTPHQSLDPDDFIPLTLEAIRRDFNFDRVIMFSIDSARRSLISSCRQPEATVPNERWPIEINIDAVSGILLSCLREKIPIISEKTEPDHPIMRQLNTAEFMAVPVLQHRRLVGIIVADNSVTKKRISPRFLTEIVPIAHQLGIALLNAKKYQAEKKHAEMDSLTEVFNKRMIDQSLIKIFQLERSKLERIAMGFVDIDKFKLFNDRCGHQAGDEAIRSVADILKRLTRTGDILGRYGGEEFLFVLMNTKRTCALDYAERIRSEIERRGKLMSPRFQNLTLTVSIGISLYNPQFSHYSEMIEVADQAMYRAKNEGRNRVILLDDTPLHTKLPPYKSRMGI